MNSHAHEEAILAMRGRLNGGPTSPIFDDIPPFSRLSLALDDPKATKLDLAVLLRHALRFGSLNVGDDLALNYDVPSEIRATTGLTKRGDAKSQNLIAKPWSPNWLEDSHNWPTDDSAMKASRRRFFSEENELGDPFLSVLKLKTSKTMEQRDATYRSSGQRDAIRCVLSMPPSSTIAIDLTTGEGKSSIFVAIDKVGFASESPGQVRGTTLVIVPTVTLALDHEINYGDGASRPHAYVGNQDDRNALIREQIDSDSQGLCFASPEATVGPLCNSLSRAAIRGTLRAVIVDEAHLVDAWGTSFRTEFQTIAGNLNSWKGRSPESSCFRTILLSATLSNSAERTLVDLFTPDEELPIVGASRVRPEIEYWVAESSDLVQRRARVREALMHLPRPAILYVTLVEDAEYWYTELKNLGFGRIRRVHGYTPSSEREQVLEAWAEGRLDLVVATSAFGLGIDYPHVRTVIHACIPESLDRFYQEAGRAGRDGCDAISMIIPAVTDSKVAHGLSTKRVISIKRGLERWTAMFENSKQYKHPNYCLSLNVAPTYRPEDIDMVGERSIDWNARTLALMARSGLIRSKGNSENLPETKSEQSVPRMNIEIIDESHLSSNTWKEKVEPKREEIKKAANKSLSLMKKFLEGGICPSRTIAEFYSTETRRVAVECSGCTLCRKGQFETVSGQLIPRFRSPWRLQGTLTDSLMRLWGQQNLLVVIYPKSDPSGRDLLDFRKAVVNLDKWGLRIFVQIEHPPKWIVDSTVQSVTNRPWIVISDNDYTPAKWVDGSRIVSFGKSAQVVPNRLITRTSNQGTIFMIPEGLSDASSPDREFADVVSCKVVSLQEFLNLVLR